MLSLEPSIKRGLTFWDRALMPPDEFAERIDLIRGEMRRIRLDALILAGNMYEDSDLLYVVGGNVDGILLLTQHDDPLIFTASGSREIFFLRQLTWILEMSHEGALVGKAMRAALERRKLSSGRIGTAGLDIMTSQAHRDLHDALAGYELQDFTPALQALRRQPRPREILALRIALGMAAEAAAAADRAFAGGASNAGALIEAERIARLRGAWDFRALANLGADDLRPYERPSEERRSPLLLWVAARYQGYWADRVAASAADPDSEAARAVAAMCAAAKPGGAAQHVADAGLAVLSAEARRSALAYGLGCGIGMRLNGPPSIGPMSDDILSEGTLLSFHVFAHGARQPSFAAAMVQLGPEGAERIEPLPRPGWP